MAGRRLGLAMPRILWAEPLEHDRMFIQAVLGQLPGRPRTEFVLDGQELLDALRANAPDLVVLDLPLPEATGLEVLSLAARRPGMPPMVVFTAADGEATLAACRRLGAAAVVRKPDDYGDFRAAVRGIAMTAWTLHSTAPRPLDALQVA